MLCKGDAGPGVGHAACTPARVTARSAVPAAHPQNTGGTCIRPSTRDPQMHAHTRACVHAYVFVHTCVRTRGLRVLAPVALQLQLNASADGGEWMGVFAGFNAVCAYTSLGNCYCWGSGTNYLLGSGTVDDASSPTQVRMGLSQCTQGMSRASVQHKLMDT